jgi:hypothetical protein
MTISTAIRLPADRNPLLFRTGILSLVGFAVCLILSIYDDRMLNGVNTWLKPMKFYAAFVVFLWTFAVILHHIPAENKVKWISRLLVMCMLMEAIPITIQAARAVPSHYNDSTLFDLILFQIMGLFILINTCVAVYVLVLYFGPVSGLSEPVKRSIQMGLLIFIAGAISGGMMVAIGSHLVEPASATHALPFLTWSRNTGDLRAAHFFTLHALQIVPLGTILLKGMLIRNTKGVFVWSTIYALFCIYLHQQALSGQPFLTW